MKLSNFTYDLPKELLAEYPSDQRDESRLMVLHRDSNKIEHKLFKDVIDYFNDGDSFILNNTKVFPARLMGNKEKTGAKIEVFLLRELNTDQRLWELQRLLIIQHPEEEHLDFYMMVLMTNSEKSY